MALQKDVFSMLKNPIAFSPVEAAKALGVSRSTIFNLLARGEIKGMKLGTRTLVPATELSRFLASLPEAEFHSHLSERELSHE
jgi:excisionase family DNA binding protein